MNLKEESKSPSYTPVEWVYRETIEEQIQKAASGKIFYFSEEEGISEASGRILRMEEIPGKGIFIFLDPENKIRIDRIITLFGKPAAAYDEYDAYSSACMQCIGPHGADDE